MRRGLLHLLWVACLGAGCDDTPEGSWGGAQTCSVVLPPIAVTDWTLEDLDARIAGVRQLFVDTLARWPARSPGSS